MTEERPATYFESAEEWRAWLTDNHATATEVWVGMFKKHAGRVGLTYPEAVEQALCFGWIDGVMNRVDGDRIRQRFTPRKSGSTWSNINIAKVADLEARGLMTEAGRAAFEARRPDRQGIYTYENHEVELSPEYLAQLAASPSALAFFESQTPSYRKVAKAWVMSAKQEKTRDKRMAELIADSEAGQLIRSQRYGRNKPPA